MPQLRSVGELAGDHPDDVGERHGRSLHRLPEPRLGHIASQDLRVIARPVDRAGIGRHAVLHQALGRLADRPGEEHPGKGRALPPGRDHRQTRTPADRTADVRQVEQR